MSKHLDITIEYLDGYTTEAKSEARIDVEPEYLVNFKIGDLCTSMLASIVNKLSKVREDEFQEVCNEASKYRHAISVAMEQIRQDPTKLDEIFNTLQESIE